MNQKCESIEDVWELNVNALTWKQVPLPTEGLKRLWHCANSYHPSPCEAVVVSFGGTPSNVFSLVESEVLAVPNTTILYCGNYALLYIS